MSVLGPLALLPGTLAPTTSSSANPSISLFAPALSEGGPRGRAEEERIRCNRCALPMSLEGVGATSELRTASKSDDMLGEGILCCLVGVVFAMRADEGGVSEIQEGGTRRARVEICPVSRAQPLTSPI